MFKFLHAGAVPTAHGQVKAQPDPNASQYVDKQTDVASAEKGYECVRARAPACVCTQKGKVHLKACVLM